MPAIGKTIRAEKIIGTWRRGGGVLGDNLLAQQPPHRQHECDGGSQHRKAERRPTEEIERHEAVPAQLAFDYHVGRGLPILITCGTRDPVGGMTASVRALIERYRQYGV